MPGDRRAVPANGGRAAVAGDGWRVEGQAAADRNPAPQNASSDTGQVPDTNPFSKSGGNNEFAAADLTAELAELTREANRANTTIYTIDPRGLVGGPDIDQTTLDSVDWQDHVRETQDSLRTIAERTGGIAVVNQNGFEKGLKRIDNETSDYYLIGHYSNNPDPLKKRRTIGIRVKTSPKRRTDKYQVSYRTSYTLKPPKQRREPINPSPSIERATLSRRSSPLA